MKLTINTPILTLFVEGSEAPALYQELVKAQNNNKGLVINQVHENKTVSIGPAVLSNAIITLQDTPK